MLDSVYVIATVLLWIAGLLVLAVAWKAKKSKAQKTNYQTFFIMGICFLSLGIVLSLTTGNPGLIGIAGIGAFYMAMGLSRMEKQKKARKRKKAKKS